VASALTFLSTAADEVREIRCLIRDDSHLLVDASVSGQERVWFKDLGELGDSLDDSPVVLIDAPRQIANGLWTIGRLTFTPTGCRSRFPGLYAMLRRVRARLESETVVWSHRSPAEGQFNYFLEGTVRNHDYVLYGFPSALRSLQSGVYFVDCDETPGTMERLRRTLRLRGVDV
jgi:hypothetical protein